MSNYLRFPSMGIMNRQEDSDKQSKAALIMARQRMDMRIDVKCRMPLISAVEKDQRRKSFPAQLLWTCYFARGKLRRRRSDVAKVAARCARLARKRASSASARRARRRTFASRRSARRARF